MGFTVSAPGKTILFGEHAVVHGVPAIAASVALHTFITVDDGDLPQYVELDFPDVNLAVGWSESDFANIVAHVSGISGVPAPESGSLPRDPTAPAHLDMFIYDEAVRIAELTIPADNAFSRVAATAFLYLYMSIYVPAEAAASHTPGHVPRRLRFRTTGTLPIGAGLGSSASFSVCVAAALLKAAGALNASTPHEDAMQLVTGWSFLGESCIHGKPSGIDNVVATRGGAVFFQRHFDGRGPLIRPYTRFPELQLILTDTRVSRHTSELVGRVTTLKERWPAPFASLMAAFDDVVAEADKLLTAESTESEEDIATKFGELADINHGLLVTVGVSHPSLELVRKTSQDLGIGYTKLTGAGGGGCAITIARRTEGDFSEQLATFRAELPDFRVFVTKLGGSGVGWSDSTAESSEAQEKLEWHYW